MQSTDTDDQPLSPTDAPTSETPLNYKVVVVGGGITGLYCAWKLPQGSVGLFEAANRWGGRVETVLMGKAGGPQFKAEFGPMRFEAPGQKRLMGLLSKLGLKTSPFPAYQSPVVVYPKYNITDAEEKRWTSPLDLLLMGILKALGRYTNGMSDAQMRAVVGTYDEAQYPALRQSARQGGKGEYLHKRGFWNVLADVLSHQAVLKIRDTGNFYHVIHENPNAIEWIIFWLRALQPKDILVGIQHGSKSLTEALLRDIDASKKPRHERHWLKSIATKDGKVHLEFNHGDKIVAVQADHVILALPKRPLEHLAATLPEPVRGDLDAVRGIPLLKCFFVVTRPWWNEDTTPHTNAGHLPVREVHYYQEHTLQLTEARRHELRKGLVTAALRIEFAKHSVKLPENIQLVSKTSGAKGWRLFAADHDYFIALADLSVFNSKGKGMVMVYTDRPATEYWNQYVVDQKQHDRAELRGSQELKARFFKYLARQLLAEVADLRAHGELEQAEPLRCFEAITTADELERELLAQVEDWGIHDWEHEPYGGAFHVWRPGVKSWEVMERLRAFGAGGRIHVAGEAFSDYQGFIEGCLNSAELALATIPAEVDDD